MPDKHHNLNQMQSVIRGKIQRIQAMKEENKETNTQITELCKELKEEYGLPRPAVNAVLMFLNWDADVQKAFDMAYPFIRDLMGATEQRDLFDPEQMRKMSGVSDEEEDEGEEEEVEAA